MADKQESSKAAAEKQVQEVKKDEEAKKEDAGVEPERKKGGIQYDTDKWDKIMDEEGEDDEELIPKKPDVANPVVAKIFSLEQFVQVCHHCNELMKTPEEQKQEKKAELKEIKEKIEQYVSIQLEDHITKKKDKKNTKPSEALFNLLVAINKEIDIEFFKTDGADLFTPIFKNTIYGKDIKYSVLNNDTLERDDVVFKPSEWKKLEVVEKRLAKIEDLESKINFIINQLLMKIMAIFDDKQMMLICIAELLYSQENFETTKRIAKVLIYFTQMYVSVDTAEKFKNEKNKFLMGSLFALGGLLKIEAKSYLMTVNEKADDDESKKDFDLIAPLSNEDNPADEKSKKFIRKLSAEDEVFFKQQFTKVVVWFIKNISQGLDQQANSETFNLLLDLTNESFYDDMTKMAKDEPEKLDKALSTHFVSRLLLDFLQFSFAYFVKTEQVNKDMPMEGAPYDNSQPVDPASDGANIGLLKLSYLINNFQDLLKELVDALARIWTNPFDLVKLWSIKFAEDPEKARKYEEQKDTYERTDIYDGQGVAVFAYLYMKKSINVVFKSDKADASDHICLTDDSAVFLSMQKYQYVLEVCIPLMNFLMQESVSHPNSKTLKQIGIEQAAFLLYMTENRPKYGDETRPYTQAGHYTKDEQQNLVFIGGFLQIMSDKNLTYLKPAQLKLCSKIGYRFLNLYTKTSIITEIFGQLLRMSPQLKKGDQAIAFFIGDYLKPSLEQRHSEDAKEAEVLLPFIFDSLLPKTTNALGSDSEYITDMQLQIEQSLHLLTTLKAKYPDHESFTKYKDILLKKQGVFDDIVRAFQTAIEALDSQMAEEKNETQKAHFKKVQDTLSEKKEACTNLIAKFKE